MKILVLSRKVGEQIWVPQFGIVLTVLAIQGRKGKELQERSSQDSAHAVASKTDSESVSVG